VSPLWRDEVGIFLGPGKIVLARMRRGMRPKFVAEQGVIVENTDDADWRPALETLAEQLGESAWQDANVRVVVSDHWTRYAVLPWSADLSTEAERLAHAKFILSNTYGELVEQWTVRLSEGKPGQSAIISAMSSDMLQQLGELLRLRSLKLISLQPQLVVSYNSWRDCLPDTAAWFASVDEGYLVAMHLTEGQCDRVRSVRISDNWSVELRRIQTMGRLAQARAEEGRVFVDAPFWLRAAADKNDAAVDWLDDDRVPHTIADKVSALKRMYT
jgi:hypothetical protein